MKERIKKIRKEKHLSQTAFGAKIGVTLGVIKNLEQGKTTLCSPLLELMCSIYNVNETWLRTGEGEMFLETQETPLLDNLKKEYNLSQKATAILENFLKLSDKEQDEFIDLAEKIFNDSKEDTETDDEFETKLFYDKIDDSQLLAAESSLLNRDSKIFDED